jgi:acetyl esterase/lipase
VLAALALPACAGRTPVSDDGATMDVPLPDHSSPLRIAYGDEPLQFGDLYLPDAAGSADGLPVVVLIHGGFWRNRYGLDLMVPLAADLASRGYAAWNLEYRRVGDEGGGWPGTLTDVAAAIDLLAVVAAEHGLDLGRVAVVGHSAGGHLALWSAGRAAIASGAPGAGPAVVPMVAIGQGPVVGLAAAAEAGLGAGAVVDVLGGPPDAHPDRYAVATPALSAGPEMVAVVGTADDIVPPPYSVDTAQPGTIDVVTIDGADHFDLIDPAHAAWAAVVDHLP